MAEEIICSFSTGGYNEPDVDLVVRPEGELLRVALSVGMFQHHFDGEARLNTDEATKLRDALSMWLKDVGRERPEPA